MRRTIIALAGLATVVLALPAQASTSGNPASQTRASVGGQQVAQSYYSRGGSAYGNGGYGYGRGTNNSGPSAGGSPGGGGA